jgi:(4-(4-[2-(gamma-L-glutamylamino)ethyl]phenoxymethyl)furan-2-yl)methanamine synthase
LMLGEIEPDPVDRSTADGRPATIECARDRLARMVGADREGFSEDDARALARSAEESLMRRLETCAHRVCKNTIGTPEVVVVSGAGEFLARRLGMSVLGERRPIMSLDGAWGRQASIAACAHALLLLAMESSSEHDTNQD